MTLTTTTTTNKMPTSAATSATIVNAQKRQPICKWSGPEYPEYEENSDVEEYPEYENEESSAISTLGVCCDCDVGLYDKSEFVCPGGANGNSGAKMCNACHNYHMNLHIGGKHGGCN